VNPLAAGEARLCKLYRAISEDANFRHRERKSIVSCRCEPLFPGRTPGRCGEAVSKCARGLLRRKSAASQRHQFGCGWRKLNLLHREDQLVMRLPAVLKLDLL
jgi:hypothetical protein